MLLNIPSFNQNLLWQNTAYRGQCIQCILYNHMVGLPCWLSGKEPATLFRRHMRHGFNPWVKKIPWRRAWQLTPVLLGESHGQRSLSGYTMKGCTESDTAEVTVCMPHQMVTAWPSFPLIQHRIPFLVLFFFLFICLFYSRNLIDISLSIYPEFVSVYYISQFIYFICWNIA